MNKEKKVNHPEVGEDSTKYGEFVSSYFAWIPLPEQKEKAKETFDFVLKTAGKHSLLGEQIDNNTLKPNWVIGLGWAHAMFIIVLEKLYKNQ